MTPLEIRLAALKLAVATPHDHKHGVNPAYEFLLTARHYETYIKGDTK